MAGGTILAVAGVLTAGVVTQNPEAWPVHSMDRPRPRVVEPAPAGDPFPPPADAIVLFDGTGLNRWWTRDHGPVGWRLVDGAMEVAGGTGSIWSTQSFGDCQLHVEWRAPRVTDDPPEGQARGNSGIYLMGMYEVQVLDSYENDTYPDGQAAAIYGQYPPMVNASRPPGEWQTFDIVFRGPRFRTDGSLAAPARMTVFHNGVLVHDNVELSGPTAHNDRPPYRRHAFRLPLMLQDHGSPVRYRNIWIRELEPPRQ